MRGEITGACLSWLELKCSAAGERPAAARITPPRRGRPAGHRGARSRRLTVELTRHDRGQLADRVLEAVVDDHVLELITRAELLLGDAAAALDLGGVVGAATDQSAAEGLQGRRRDEHLGGLGHRRPVLTGTLYLDIQHARQLRSEVF